MSFSIKISCFFLLFNQTLSLEVSRRDGVTKNMRHCKDLTFFHIDEVPLLTARPVPPNC